MKGHTINVSDEVYDYLKDMIEDEHIANSDNDGQLMPDGRMGAHRPTFSEVISHLIEDRELDEIKQLKEQVATLNKLLDDVRTPL